MRGGGLVDALRASRENQAGRVMAENLRPRRAGRQHDGKHASLAGPAGDQLRVLTAEVEDDEGSSRGHAEPARSRKATGAARTAATGKATGAAPNGATATSTGATSAPGASRAASRSPTATRTAVARRKTTVKVGAKALRYEEKRGFCRRPKSPASARATSKMKRSVRR